MKSILSNPSHLSTKNSSENNFDKDQNNLMNNVENKHKHFFASKKQNKINRKQLMENAVFLSELLLMDEKVSLVEEEDEKQLNEVKKEDLSYLEKQNQFFKDFRNIPKKMPSEIAFTQEVEFNNKDKIEKNLSIIETNDYDKVSPKNKKKEVEILTNKNQLSLLFNDEDKES